jgi:hypothetical protein
MYPWIVFLHVTGGFTFVLAHGASASVAFALRHERNSERIRALLDLSPSFFNVMYLSLLVLLAAGLQYMESFKPHPPLEPASAAELDALLAHGQPVPLTVIGFGGLILILWLMMFKPF